MPELCYHKLDIACCEARVMPIDLEPARVIDAHGKCHKLKSVTTVLEMMIQ